MNFGSSRLRIAAAICAVLAVSHTFGADISVSVAVDEVLDNIKEATPTDFYEVNMSIITFSEKAPDYSSMPKGDRSANSIAEFLSSDPDTVTNRVVEQTISFYKGVNNTERTEKGPILVSARKEGREAVFAAAPATIGFRDEGGKLYEVRDKISLGRGGVLLVDTRVREVKESAPHVSLAQAPIVGENFIFSTGGIPYDVYFGRELSNSSSATKVVDEAEGKVRYTFHFDSTAPTEFILDFKKTEQGIFPLSYELLRDGEPVESQVWKYQELNGIVVPSQSHLLKEGLLDDAPPTEETVQFHFGQDGPLPRNKVLQKTPLTEEMRALHARGRDVQGAAMAERAGIALSGESMSYSDYVNSSTE